MKILFVADVSIQDDLSGAERVLLEQTNRLAARGHHIDIMTRRLAVHRSDCSVLGNVSEWRYRVNQKNAFSFFLTTLRNGKRLFEYLNNVNHYGCINFHQPFSAFAVACSKKSKPIRKIYTCHSLSFEEYVSRSAKPHSFMARITTLLQRSVRKWIEKTALEAADRVIVLSRFTRDKLLATYHLPLEKMVIIPGGIDLNRFHPAADKSRVRDSLGLPRGKTILLTVRGLEPRMGIDNLIRAMPDIVRALPDTHLIIGGAGPLKDELIAMARRLNLDHHIQFAGFIPEADLPRYYQATDLFVLPTIELEGFGLVTLEALASGTPVLGTPVGGTRDILGTFDRRFLFQDASPESIAVGITEICREYKNDAGKWQRDSRRCRQFVVETYSWEKNIDATERLFFEN